MNERNNMAQLIVGCIVALAAIGAITALEMTGHEYGMVIGIAGPVVAALLVNSHISGISERQNQEIDQIKRQTNGVLDQRIEDGVGRALLKVGVVQPTATIPAPPSPTYQWEPPVTPPPAGDTLGRHYARGQG